MIHMPPGSTLTVRDTEAGQLGTLTATGVVPQAGEGNADYGIGTTRAVSSNTTQSTGDPYSCLGTIAQCNKQNWLQKTIVKYADKPNEQYIEEAWKSLNHKQQKRLLPGNT